MHPRRQNSGASLVEALIACAVAGIGVMVYLSTFSGSSDAARRLRGDALLARNAIERELDCNNTISAPGAFATCQSAAGGAVALYDHTNTVFVDAAGSMRVGGLPIKAMCKQGGLYLTYYDEVASAKYGPTWANLTGPNDEPPIPISCPMGIKFQYYGYDSGNHANPNNELWIWDANNPDPMSAVMLGKNALNIGPVVYIRASTPLVFRFGFAQFWDRIGAAYRMDTRYAAFTSQCMAFKKVNLADGTALIIGEIDDSYLSGGCHPQTDFNNFDDLSFKIHVGTQNFTIENMATAQALTVNAAGFGLAPLPPF